MLDRVQLILALLSINYEEQVLSGLGDVVKWLYTVPWLGDYLIARAEETDGTLALSGEDLKSFVVRGWMAISLLFGLVGAVLSWLFGPFKQLNYVTKLLLATGATLLILAGFMTVFFTGRVNFSGGSGSWMITFGGITVTVFLVSVWSLSMAHVLGMLKRGLEPTLGDDHTAR